MTERKMLQHQTSMQSPEWKELLSFCVAMITEWWNIAMVKSVSCGVDDLNEYFSI
jgi:hypothetical protein